MLHSFWVHPTSNYTFTKWLKAYILLHRNVKEVKREDLEIGDVIYCDNEWCELERILEGERFIMSQLPNRHGSRLTSNTGLPEVCIYAGKYKDLLTKYREF